MGVANVAGSFVNFPRAEGVTASKDEVAADVAMLSIIIFRLEEGWMRSKELIFRVARAVAAASLLIAFQGAVAQVNDPPPVPVHPSPEFLSFLDKYASAERVDPFYFFKNFPDYKGKVMMMDAIFQKKISPDMFFAKIWRNFGSITLVVTNVPDGVNIPDNHPFLLVGLMTDFKNEVVGGNLVSMPIIKYMDTYVCKQHRCNQ
jgi:hypothetical protein